MSNIQEQLKELLAGSDEPDVKEQRKLFYISDSDPMYAIIAAVRDLSQKIPPTKKKIFLKFVAGQLQAVVKDICNQILQLQQPQPQQQQQQQQPQQQQQQPQYHPAKKHH